MRVSRAQAEANRDTVVSVASRLFREHGFDGVGLKALMEGAGLTHGGFYKQFESKDDLAAQASRRAMEGATRRWSTAAASGHNALQAVIDLYLSAEHKREVGDGCPLVALGADAARQSETIRKPFEDGIKAHLRVIEELLPDGAPASRSEKAMATLSLMVGAVLLSRIVTDEALSDDLLSAAASEVRKIIGAEGA
jgi:TetR/AcrR family transcriptional repressor of nem operon